MFRPIALALPLLAAACARYEGNCLNDHVAPEYGTVKAIPGGFEVQGSGVRQTTIEVSQVPHGMRPGTAGDLADDSPKPMQRTFSCRPL